MDEILNIKKWYLENFETFQNNLNGGSRQPINNLRKDAILKFSELNFPTTKDEEWKYTNISPLLKHHFKPASANYKVEKTKVDQFRFNDFEAYLAVFINGTFAPDLSELENLPGGVVISSLDNAINSSHPAVQKYFSKYADYSRHIFTSLNTAFTKDGSFIYIPDREIIEKPIHILFISLSDGEKILSQPRNLFSIGKNSQVKILEHFVSLDEGVYFTNSVSEISAGENAIISHVKLQEESKNSFHIHRIEVELERSSNFSSHSISLGGSISRNDLNVRFNGEGGESTLNGLYLTEREQLYDTHTMIDHAKPYCTSHEHYKGILDNRSRGVFNGKVMVRKDAQKTNAFQENNNIILSAEALVNTKPQLEIFADDVKCTHGATIGQLDMDSMFYLKSRGIGQDTARAILIHAFASDVIKSIPLEPVRNYAESILTEKFNKQFRNEH
ncbi:MAG TPA: Fe-S cluster assembly protein SufD [Ignavibacteriaceae bacterium]|nr:Fe-S cluster assembly protein SufD [Ignavibacteriaceae bacterium]